METFFTLHRALGSHDGFSRFIIAAFAAHIST